MIYRQNDLTDFKLTRHIDVLQQKRLMMELCGRDVLKQIFLETNFSVQNQNQQNFLILN